eukprot:GHRQ01014635.1.p1 GENE.GHRQ01014635.1~~GHRQ01014635.1.p1  ORF type:complete len:200 (+),score=47.09 GHRQ01014635.1:222-821(+)
MGSVVIALVLTGLGALGTALGGLLVVLQPSLSFKRLGALQGLAAGLMLSISVMDLLPEAVEEIGFVAANISFYVGVLFFAAIVALIPEPDALFFAGSPRNDKTTAAAVVSSSKAAGNPPSKRTKAAAAVRSSSSASPAKDEEGRSQLLVEAAAASAMLPSAADRAKTSSAVQASSSRCVAEQNLCSLGGACSASNSTQR